jgi:diguanylate cyclase (GGDEF)-like protein
LRPTERLAQLEAENLALRRAIELLHQIANLVRGAQRWEPTCYALLTGVTAGVGLGLNRAMLFLADPADRTVLRGVAAVGPDDAGEADRVWRSLSADPVDLQTLYERGFAEHQAPGALDARVRRVVIRTDDTNPVALSLRRDTTIAGQGSSLDGLFDPETCVAAPCHGRDGFVGVLYADNRFTGKPVDWATRLVFGLVAGHAGRALESARLVERLTRLAKTDALTGLPHHGALMQDLHTALGSATARRQPLGFAMIDVDDFKRINDTHGHPVGDLLLEEVARRIRTVTRGGEAAYRYGGEEFAVILTDADTTTAAAVGERIREALAHEPVRVDGIGGIELRCSLGVASYPNDATTVEQLVAAADAALLSAKAAGKNRVVHA